MWEFWPWPLLLLDDTNTPEVVKQAIRRAFIHLQVCCVPETDGFTWPARTQVNTGADLETQDFKDLIEEGLNNGKPTNTVVEDCFSRHRRHFGANMGRPPAPPTIASDHVLSHFKLLHEYAAQSHEAKFEELHPSRRRVAQPTTEAKKPLTIFQKYVIHRTSEVSPPPSFKEISADWKRMSKDEQGEFRSYEVEELATAMPPAPPIPVEATPFGFGDQDFAVRLQNLEEYVFKVSEYSERFEANTKDIIGPRALLTSRPGAACCCAKYGIHFCERDFTRAQIQTLDRHRHLLGRLAEFDVKKEEVLPPGFLVQYLRLFRLTPVGNDEVEPLLLIIATQMLLPVMFIGCHFSPSRVDVGEVAEQRHVGARGFIGPQKLTMLLNSMSDEFRVERLRYRWIAPHRLRILETEAIPNILCRLLFSSADCKERISSVLFNCNVY